MGGKMSRDKGKRAEREVVRELQPVLDRIAARHGIDAERLKRNTMQSDGGGFDIHGIRWMAPEVKHHETFALNSWWKQTVEQASPTQEPVLFYRKNNVKFRVRMFVDARFGPCEAPRIVVDIDMPTFLEIFEQRAEAELLA